MNNKNLQNNNNKASRIDSKMWIEAFKKSASYPEVRPDSSPRKIDSKRWEEAARKADKKAKNKEWGDEMRESFNKKLHQKLAVY